MGKLSSVLAATLLYIFGVYIFRKPDFSSCGPLLASLFMLLAAFLVLWTIPIYPRKLRKLVPPGDVIAQYLIAAFCIEHIMSCFWFPLETAVLAFLPRTATCLEETLLNFDVTCHFPCDLLRKEGTGMFMSYLISFLILLAALHATRIINLNLIMSGSFHAFVYDISRRFQYFLKTLPDKIGIRSLRSHRSRKSAYCASDEEDFTFEPGADDPTDTTEYHYSYR